MNDRALKVLEQYELEVTGVRRGRGSYLFETPQGLRILCDYNASESKALFQNSVMDKIRAGGYSRVDQILPNREGELVSRDWEENKYVVKEWYPGRECDTSNESEIMMAVTNLAKLHRLMHLEGDSRSREMFTAPEPKEELCAQNAELRRVRSFMRKKNTKCDFERLFLSCFSHYYEQAQEAEQQLASLGVFFGTLPGSAAGVRRTGVCHGDYNHHHILMAGYEIATTNFESCRFDVQINDLYRFMRKILEKHDWNVRLGMRMLENYTLVRPISAQERRLLYVRMLYPEKFRKLANYYYGSNKAWISHRFQDKLEKLNRQEKTKDIFVKMLEK